MKTVRMRIIQERMPPYWYAGLLGKIFEFYVGSHDYVLKEDCDKGARARWRHLAFEDGEEIEEDEAV